MEGDNSELLLHIQTVQGTAFRNLFETLKDVLTDANMVVDSNESEPGIRILCMDNSHTALVSCRLDRGSFEHFECKQRMHMGINMQNIYKLFKSVGNTDTIALKVHASDTTRLEITINNTEKSSKTVYKLNLLDLDQHKLVIPDTYFDSVITMPSNDLQRICRDMNVISDQICFESSGRSLLLKCKGDFAEQCTVIGQTQNGLLISNNTDASSSSSVQGPSPGQDTLEMGTFSLKYLNLFSRATNLCGTVDIYLKNQYPLILCFAVASLGKLLFCLAPIKSQD